MDNASKFDKLNPKYKVFVEALIRTGNKSLSYREAGYKPKTTASATASATNLLKKSLVSEYYQFLIEEAQKANVMNITEVLERKTKIARGEPIEFDNKCETYSEYTNSKNKRIKGTNIKNRKGVYTPTIEEQDKALTDLYKMLTLAEDAQSSNVNVTIVDSWSNKDE